MVSAEGGKPDGEGPGMAPGTKAFSNAPGRLPPGKAGSWKTPIP